MQTTFNIFNGTKIDADTLQMIATIAASYDRNTTTPETQFLTAIEFKGFQLLAMRAEILKEIGSLTTNDKKTEFVKNFVKLCVLALLRGTNFTAGSKLSAIPEAMLVGVYFNTNFKVQLNKQPGQKIGPSDRNMNRFLACMTDLRLATHERLSNFRPEWFPDRGTNLRMSLRAQGMGSVVSDGEIDEYKKWCWSQTSEVTSGLSKEKKAFVTRENNDKFIMIAYNSTVFRAKP